MTSAEGKITFSDFLNLFLLNQKYDLGVLIKALQNRGLFQSLAEPNLVAESGKEASFLAGGEFPVPVAQGSGANIGVSVMFKEFGIRLNFTPTVTGDRVHLKVRPEVSTLDYGNAVVLNGFRIPALSTRRTETAVELRERSDVRDRRSDEQPDADDDAEDSGHRRHSDHRPSVPQQGRRSATRPSSS